ncbi:hypothetical protein DFH06DRAFT_1128061 [Mycena polygramma]|nr:hypothetical protein DFH06DRAFT_1128061 [Mycena polygramma]
MKPFIDAHFPVFPSRLLPVYCSCAWEEWHDIDFFCVPLGWYNLSEAEYIFHHCFKLVGGVRPLAWRDLGSDPNVLWEGFNEVLTRYGRFLSDEAFLGNLAVAMSDMGAKQALPVESGKVWRRIYTEQRALLRRAEETPSP